MNFRFHGHPSTATMDRKIYNFVAIIAEHFIKVSRLKQASKMTTTTIVRMGLLQRDERYKVLLDLRMTTLQSVHLGSSHNAQQI